MGKYIKYVIENMEPLRIADDSSSQNGQTSTLRYIPGTSIRGYVIQQLSKKEEFETIKKQLFSVNTKYMNAYMMIGNQVLLPSPKGFYENKQETVGKKELQNVVVDGTFSGECKRAGLGRYCYIKDDCIYYYNVDTSSDLKIKINLNDGEKQNVFRNDYITPGHRFTGYIYIEDEKIGSYIQDVLKNVICIGNARSSGLGKCKVLECGYTQQIPYETYMPKQNLKNHCYMMLLSAATMRDENGELCGLDIKSLEEKMGVKNLRIAYCSTSTVTVCGYNRMWRCKIPSATMYEQGSVFHFVYDGELKIEKMKALMHQGIGIRRNEGFGRVIFLDSYENVKFKMAGEYENTADYAKNTLTEEERHVLKIAARGYYNNVIQKKMEEYVVKNPLTNRKNVSNSQLGIIESFVNIYKYSPLLGEQKIKEYLEYAQDKQNRKNVQKEKSNISEFGKLVLKILNCNLEEFLALDRKKVMDWEISDIFTQEEILKMKLMLIQNLIRYEYKKGEE